MWPAEVTVFSWLQWSRTNYTEVINRQVFIWLLKYPQKKESHNFPKEKWTASLIPTSKVFLCLLLETFPAFWCTAVLSLDLAFHTWVLGIRISWTTRLRPTGHWSVPEPVVQIFFFSLSKSTLSIGVVFYKVMNKHYEQMSMGEISLNLKDKRTDSSWGLKLNEQGNTLRSLGNLFFFFFIGNGHIRKGAKLGGKVKN